MRWTAVRPLAVATLGGLVLVVSGCGGGSKSSAETPAATTAAAPTTVTEEQTTTESKTTEISAVASAADCRQLAELGTKFAEAMGASGGATDTEATAKFLAEFADRTPKEIRADFQVLAANYAKIVKALEGIKTTPGKAPDAAALAKLQKVIAEIDQPALTKAETHITAWVNANCKG